MARKKKPVELEFFTFNISVLPPAANTKEFYSRLIERYFEKSLRIKYGNTFYYVMTEMNKIDEGNAYYCVVSKFLQLDTIEWVEQKDGAISPFTIPDNLEGRKGVYEFIFYPEKHKIAFIKKGKLNDELKSRGAPFKAIAEVLKIGFEQVVEDGSDVYVDVETSQDVIDKILSSKVLRLDVSVHYTNPTTNGDHEEFMDELFRDTRSGKINISTTAGSSGEINTDSKFINGTLGIAQDNGKAKAKIKTETGIENINTADHPKVSTASAKNDGNKFINLVKDIIEKLKV